MPNLKQQDFHGRGDIPASWRDRPATSAYGAGIWDTLSSLGLGRKTCATICLGISTDGLRVTNGSFGLWGALYEEVIKMQTNKLCEGTPRVTTMLIRGITGQAFTFSCGLLYSDYLDQNKLELSFSKAGQPIPPQDRASLNIGKLLLRAIAHLDKTSNCSKRRIKFTVLTVPMSADDLVELSDRTLHVSWPGMKILESSADFSRRHLRAVGGLRSGPYYAAVINPTASRATIYSIRLRR